MSSILASLRLTSRRRPATLMGSWSSMRSTVKPLSSETESQTTEKTTEEADEVTSSSSPSSSQTFAHLLRTCPHTQLGNPVGKVFVGRIYHVVNDDIYIDYGGKFPIVCQRTRNRRSEFVRGTLVRVMLKREEMSERFLGFDRDLSLLEAEGVLLGLYKE